MAKKLGSFRLLSGVLAVLATIAFIVACGDGVPDSLDDFMEGVLISEDKTKNKIEEIVDSSEPPPLPQSSNSGGGEESSDSGSDNTSSSSSEEQQPSSTSPGVSSQSNVESSNSIDPSLYNLECNILPANSTFPSGTKIPIDKRPEIKCTVIATGEVIPLHNDNDVTKWTNDPPWNPPAVGTYDNILVKIDREKKTDPRECQGMEVKCNGKITITGTVTPSSNSTPPTQSSSSRATTASSSSRATTASSSSRAASSSSAPPPASGDYCYYGPGNCHKMPTDDNCKDGNLVSSCDNVKAEYCDYGVCKGGSGWDCKDGGGCYIKKSGDTCNGGSVVTSCPKDHLPPSAQ